MMKKIISCGFLFMAFIAVVNAQTDQKSESKGIFQPGWYMSLYTGYNIYLAEGNNIFNNGSSISLRRNGSPLATFGLGYDFNPILGLRGELGWQRFHWNGTSAITGTANPVWWGTSLTGDLTVNLSNWWGGYNPDRIFDVTAFGGLGLGVRSAHNVDAKKQVTPIVRAGLIGAFHLSKQFDLNGEIATNLVRDAYNGVRGGWKVDDFTAFQVGFTYHFKPTVKPVPAPVPEPVIQVKEVVKHDTVIQRVEVPVKVAQNPVEVQPFTREIFFTIGRTKVNDYNQKSAIADAAEYLKANPGKKMSIDGYADKKTGTNAINMKISKIRAQAIADELIKVYGISADRIVAKGHGDVPQIYSPNDKNRVTVLKSIEN
jgi:Outer membrane protein and related peptidoglycan-associated (lipo)proteins